jgi:gas vesicle protein
MMSYAGPASRSRTPHRSTSAPSSPRGDAARQRARRDAGTKSTQRGQDTDWAQVAIFGAGLALGIALGASAALLTAPRSGAEIRAALRARAGRVSRTARRRGHDAWEELRDELRRATRARRRRQLQRREARALEHEMDREATSD